MNIITLRARSNGTEICCRALSCPFSAETSSYSKALLLNLSIPFQTHEHILRSKLQNLAAFVLTSIWHPSFSRLSPPFHSYSLLFHASVLLACKISYYFTVLGLLQNEEGPTERLGRRYNPPSPTACTV